jgi:hypothetical protein
MLAFNKSTTSIPQKYLQHQPEGFSKTFHKKLSFKIMMAQKIILKTNLRE